MPATVTRHRHRNRNWTRTHARWTGRPHGTNPGLPLPATRYLSQLTEPKEQPWRSPGCGRFSPPRRHASRSRPSNRRQVGSCPAARNCWRCWAVWRRCWTRYGYLAIVGLIMLKDFGVPVPGKTVLIAGAIYAGAGRLNIVAVVVIAVATAMVGDKHRLRDRPLRWAAAGAARRPLYLDRENYPWSNRSRRGDLNPEPTAYKAVALPVELRRRVRR